MVSRMVPSLLALAVVALVVSSSFASNDAPAAMVPGNGAVTEDGTPYCQVVWDRECSIAKCTSTCAGLGLFWGEGYCALTSDYLTLCCCPVPSSGNSSPLLV
ncbi:hypothetical protein EJB05_31413 [Eragrostis curvula]|uniref:Knottin scorpion toxin-like domain-containing protein n=1 Tax=Eragrostis curvula TaxID=38414 RepID=A0A5J9UDZ4_9POAL|nr:hypothetical protein EJB05_31413 [Eragrostis curvula]